MPIRLLGQTRDRTDLVREAHGAASTTSRSPTLEWVDWFTRRRLLETIGNIPPAGCEAADYRTTEPTATTRSRQNQPSTEPEAIHYLGSTHPLSG